jgi:hypothetical protein
MTIGPSQVSRTQSMSFQVTVRSKLRATHDRKSVTRPRLPCTAPATDPRLCGRPFTQTSHIQAGWVRPSQAVLSAPESPLDPVKPERTSR